MNLRDDDHIATYEWLREIESRDAAASSSASVATAVSQGSIGYSAGGPLFLDIMRSKRAPTPPELVNAFKAVAFACIRLNMSGVARVPLRLFAKTRGGERAPGRDIRSISRRVPLTVERRLRAHGHYRAMVADADRIDEIHESPFLDAFACPNPWFDENLLLQYLACSLDVVGAAYLCPTRINPTIAPSQLWPLQSQYVMPIQGGGEKVVSYYQFFNEQFLPDELIRFRTVSMRDPYLSGYAPLHACLEQVGLVDYYTAVVESIYKEGGMPSGMIVPTDPAQTFGKDEAKRLEKDVNNKFVNGRQGRIWVPSGGYKFERISDKPVDLGGLEISKNARLLAANCFDVPISLLQAEDSNKAVASEGTHQHQYYAIEPRCVLIASAITHQLLHAVDDRLFVAFDDPVQRNVVQDATIFDMALKNGTRTINEVRGESGLEPVEWGDEPWLSTTLSQPSAMVEAREQAQANLDQGRQDALEAAGKAQADGASAETPGEPDPDPDETPDPEEDDAERQASQVKLERRALRVLATIQKRLALDARSGNGLGNDPPAASNVGQPRSEEHVPPAERPADPVGAADVVPSPAGGDAGNPVDDRRRPAEDLPEPGEL